MGVIDRAVGRGSLQVFAKVEGYPNVGWRESTDLGSKVKVIRTNY